MTALYLQLKNMGEIEAVLVPHKTTPVPQDKRAHLGAKPVPTKYLIRHRNMWRRVYVALNGSLYIVSAYMRIPIVVHGADAL